MLLALETPGLTVFFADLDDLLLDYGVFLHPDLGPLLSSHEVNLLFCLNFLCFNQHTLLLHLAHLSLLLLFAQFSNLVGLFLDLAGLVKFELIQLHLCSAG